ncbi:MAG: alpha/beta hydrolase [Paludibaculum sp.]
MIATTHPRDFSLSGLTIPITKIYATNDGVASVARMRLNAQLLPAATKWIAIDGGNHVQLATTGISWAMEMPLSPGRANRSRSPRPFCPKSRA